MKIKTTLKQLFCNHALVPVVNGEYYICSECKKLIKPKLTWRHRERKENAFYAIVLFAMALSIVMLGLVFMSSCSGERQKCWECIIVTKYHDPLYPNLVEVKGTFQYCDTIPIQDMQHFQNVNTYSDSTMTQTCKCKYVMIRNRDDHR